MAATVRSSRWYAISQSHAELMNEFVQKHIELIREMQKPRSMGGPNDFLADSALRRMRDIINELCDAVELSEETVVL